MGLKSRPIPTPPPLRGGENPHGTKWGGAGQAGRGKITIPNSSGYWANAIVRSSRTFTYGGNIETVVSPPYGQGGPGKKKNYIYFSLKERKFGTTLNFFFYVNKIKF